MSMMGSYRMLNALENTTLAGAALNDLLADARRHNEFQAICGTRPHIQRLAATNAMEAVAASPVAMEAVAASPVAMEAVAESPVAMEAVAASPVAMEALRQSPLAVETESAMAAMNAWRTIPTSTTRVIVVDLKWNNSTTGDHVLLRTSLHGGQLSYPSNGFNWVPIGQTFDQVEARDDSTSTSTRAVYIRYIPIGA